MKRGFANERWGKESFHHPPPSLGLSLYPPPPTFHLPSPTLCDTSAVQDPSEWVWRWRRFPPSIVGNVRISLHCCKYGVERAAAQNPRCEGHENVSHSIPLSSADATYGICCLIEGLLFLYNCVRGGVCGVTTMTECAHDLSLTG